MFKPTAFAPVPESAELADVPRDLRFHPLTNSAPKVLTPLQVDAGAG
jgi:hypothetical protein